MQAFERLVFEKKKSHIDEEIERVVA